MDFYLLEYTVKRKGMTVSEFCDAIGISRSAYYRRKDGKCEFTRTEISKCMDVLGLDSPVPIFFGKEVS